MGGTDGLAELLGARYGEAEKQVNDRLCIHCGIPTCEIRHSLGVFDYTHGTTPDWDGWQGRRCPGRTTGAEPVQNPAHRLADIKLKRAILAQYHQAQAFSDHMFATAAPEGIAVGEVLGERIRAAAQVLTLERVLRQLGTEFDQHPEYQAGWAP